MDFEPRNYLTVFPLENTNNKDVTKDWEIGIRYHNNNWDNWKICYPRKVSCRPLRLDLYFNDGSGNVNLYPSCNFINMPNEYKTVKPGEIHDHMIDITPWRDCKWNNSKYKDSKRRDNSAESRVRGTFTLYVTYPHVHHYAVGKLKWTGWY